MTEEITFEDKPPAFKFHLNNDPEPIMVIADGKFIWKGQEIEDVHQVYEKFCEFMRQVNYT